MSARDADVKHTSLYASAYVDGSKNSSSISSANGYRFALLVVTGVFGAADSLRVLVNCSDDTSFGTNLHDITLEPGAPGTETKTYMLDKSLLPKNIRVRLIGAGGSGPDTRPSATVSAFEFGSKHHGDIQADYQLPAAA